MLQSNSKLESYTKKFGQTFTKKWKCLKIKFLNNVKEIIKNSNY
jgi:hypothetical protein